jgi:hypothetical protein
MTHDHQARPALDPELAAVLGELVLTDEDYAPAIAATSTPWHSAAISASLRYHEWALADAARSLELSRAADEARILAYWKERDAAAAGRKRRRVAQAEREGRDYVHRATLRDMSAEDRAARRREQNCINQRRRREGPSIESHPLHGRF